MLKLKLQYFGHLVWRVDPLEKSLTLGGIGGRRRRGRQKMRWLDGITSHGLDGCEFEWTPGVGDGQGGLACCDSWGCKELDRTERLNWTELILEGMTTLYISSPSNWHTVRNLLINACWMNKWLKGHLLNEWKLNSSFANKEPSSQGYGSSSDHIWMWELSCEER